MSVWRPASRRRRRWYWKRKEGGLDINKGYPESTQIDGILAIPAYTEMIIIFKTPTDHINWKPHLKWSCWWTNMPMGPILVFHAQTWDKILRQVLHLTVVVFVESTKCHMDRVRLFNVGLHFLAAKVAFSCPSVDRFGKKIWGLMTLGQVESVPNFC